MYEGVLDKIDSIMDGVIDTLKLVPYLFITFIILEILEHKLNKKNEKVLTKNKKYGPFIGSLLGAIPQCGFSTMAANLFSSRVITIGTLVAVFLSTSDEMLPIMISEKVNITIILKIIGFKIIVGMIVGLIVDLILKSSNDKLKNHIHDRCEDDHCHCDEDGIIKSSIKHTLKIGLFILVANLVINIIIFSIGEDKLSDILLSKNIFTYFISSLVGLIPNCASSVIITELYLSNLITLGCLLAGLLPGSGVGILLLFKTNKNMKENILILSIIYFVGVVLGILVDIII